MIPMFLGSAILGFSHIFGGHQFKVCLFGFWFQQCVDVHPKKWYNDPPWLMRVCSSCEHVMKVKPS
jgi:hypothetical protein